MIPSRFSSGGTMSYLILIKSCWLVTIVAIRLVVQIGFLAFIVTSFRSQF